MSVIERLFKRRTRVDAASRGTAQLADPLIDRIVAATDKRLALVKGYREKLREPVAQAFRELHPKIQAIPGPTEVSAQGWRGDDTVRSLFAHADDAAAAFSNEGNVHDFFALHPAGDCFALLALLTVERRVLAPALQGETLQTEVARTTVSFTEPQVLAPSADESAVREALVARAIEYLALRALQRVGAMRTQKRELEQERALLQAELQLARRRGAGFGSIDRARSPGEVATLERDLEKTVRELEKAASRHLLPALLDEICAVLQHPGEHLTLEPCSLALDSMNFAVTPSAHATTPRVSILGLAGRGPFAVLVARFPRTALRPDNRLADAAKYL
jgi:hypothetical protein